MLHFELRPAALTRWTADLQDLPGGKAGRPKLGKKKCGTVGKKQRKLRKVSRKFNGQQMANSQRQNAKEQNIQPGERPRKEAQIHLQTVALSRVRDVLIGVETPSSTCRLLCLLIFCPKISKPKYTWIVCLISDVNWYNLILTDIMVTQSPSVRRSLQIFHMSCLAARWWRPLGSGQGIRRISIWLEHREQNKWWQETHRSHSSDSSRQIQQVFLSVTSHCCFLTVLFKAWKMLKNAFWNCTC